MNAAHLPSPEALAADPAAALAPLNQWLAEQSLEARVAWALERLPGNQALSSSFGAQAAVSLHLVTRLKPEIPVIVVDTGYLFAETYRFIDSLTERLDLKLHIARPRLSPAWLEARYGKLWENGVAGLDQYNRLMKVEPMQQALEQLGVKTWYAGLRRAQAESRAERQFVEFNRGRFKLHPLLDLTDRAIGQYLKAHDLPYHPLWEAGYLSIGDVHTSRRWEPGMREEDTRFFGLKRECGLHLDV